MATKAKYRVGGGHNVDRVLAPGNRIVALPVNLVPDGLGFVEVAARHPDGSLISQVVTLDQLANSTLVALDEVSEGLHAGIVEKAEREHEKKMAEADPLVGYGARVQTPTGEYMVARCGVKTAVLVHTTSGGNYGDPAVCDRVNPARWNLSTLLGGPVFGTIKVLRPTGYAA